MNNKIVGAWGERNAAKYLEKKGYKIVGVNYKNRFGEIDIIARRKDCVVFIEVKTRKNNSFADAREFVDAKKQARVITAAKIWLSANRCELQPRFDVIEVYAPHGTDTKNPEINHIENAFS